jgi:predicted nucleotidyltransferase
MDIEKIRKDLSEVSEYDILLFGSVATGNSRPGSDIDIAILAYTEDEKDIVELKMNTLGKIPENYDMSVLEALPTIVKASVLKNYIVIFGNPPDIGEYLRKYWKECHDYSFRFELPTIREMMDGL